MSIVHIQYRQFATANGVLSIPGLYSPGFLTPCVHTHRFPSGIIGMPWEKYVHMHVTPVDHYLTIAMLHDRALIDRQRAYKARNGKRATKRTLPTVMLQHCGVAVAKA